VLAEDQLSLHYQPQVDASGRICGAEALLRWHDSVLGDLSPQRFVPLAEESGLIVPIGLWVLEQACWQLARWAAHPHMAGLSLSVNVSVCQLRQPDFVAQLRAILAQTAAPPAQLVLELTESVLMDDDGSGSSKMRALRRLGVRLALDDFGTGYSSLSYLKKLPLDQLKLDQSFVQGMLHDGPDAAIVRAVLGLAQTLQLDVLAEGVESQAQYDSLLACGCQHFQGYLFGAPQPLAAFEQLLAAAHSRS
jgi:EAL domain-containing protein (putative c-di-GMP-specific phosphodiesterase class I)